MSITREMLSAGPGCAMANGMLNGLETTKVKLQLHKSTKPIYHTPTTAGVMRQIIQEEGIVRGLMMPGLSASLTRSMLYGAYRVGLYSTTRDWLAGASNNNARNSNNNSTPTLMNRIASGMFTGGLGAMLTCPLDVVRTRMQADAGVINYQTNMYQTGLRRGRPVRYPNMVTAFLRIFQQEGLQNGLYRGASVTIARASLLNGSQLASYDTLKKLFKSSGGSDEEKESPILHVVCALASGIIAQTVVMPVDTIKSSMMLGQCPRGVWRTMMENGGLMWLYRGYVPACAGQGLIMVLQMPLIEQFRSMLGVRAI